MIDELATWAESTERPLQGDREEAEMLLRLLRDHLGVEDPGDLAQGPRGAAAGSVPAQGHRLQR